MSTPKGWPTQEKDQRLQPQFATVEPVRTLQHGLSVLAHQFVMEAGTAAAEAGSTSISIIATSSGAEPGDVIRLTSGALSGREIKVYSVSGNVITLAEELPSAVAAGVTFQILRHKYPLVESTGEVKVSATIDEVAVAPDGDPLPAEVKVVGGYDGSAVQVIKTDSAGELQVDVLSSALPAGASTSTAQTDGSQKTQIVDGSGNVIGSTGNALDVNLKTPITVDVSLSQANDSVAVFGSDGAVNRALKTDASGELQIDVLSSALPAGAATETTAAAIQANQTNGTQKSQIVNGTGAVVNVKALSAQLLAADNALVSATVIHGLTTGGGGGYVDIKANPSGALTVEADVTSSVLPTGAATSANQTSEINLLTTIDADTGSLAGCVSGTEVQVDVVAPLPSGTNTIGKVDLNTLSVVDLLDANILDTSGTNIPGSASSPVQVVASTAAAVKELQLLDTTGAFIGLYTGAAASEVLRLVIGPGSDQTIQHSIPAGTRISLKRLDSTTAVSSGIVAINFIG